MCETFMSLGVRCPCRPFPSVSVCLFIAYTPARSTRVPVSCLYRWVPVHRDLSVPLSTCTLCVSRGWSVPQMRTRVRWRPEPPRCPSRAPSSSTRSSRPTSACPTPSPRPSTACSRSCPSSCSSSSGATPTSSSSSSRCYRSVVCPAPVEASQGSSKSGGVWAGLS